MEDNFIDTCPTMKMAIILTQKEGQTYEQAISEAIFQMRARTKEAYKIYNSYNGDDHNTLFYNAELLKRNLSRLLEAYYLYYIESLEQIKNISNKKQDVLDSDIDYLEQKCIESSQYIEIKSKLISIKKCGHILKDGNAVKLSNEEIANLKNDIGNFRFATIKTAKNIISECEKCLKILMEQNLSSSLKQKINSTLEIVSSYQPEK